MGAITEPHLSAIEPSPECSPSERNERLRPSPISGHSLTKEDAARGGRTRAARIRAEREEARKSVAQRIAERIELESERVMAPYFAAIDSGDWRAAEALLDRTYGKATQRQEIEDVTEREELDDTARERHARIRDELKRRNAA